MKKLVVDPHKCPNYKHVDDKIKLHFMFVCRDCMQHVPRFFGHLKNFEFWFGKHLEWQQRAEDAVKACKYQALTLIEKD